MSMNTIPVREQSAISAAIRDELLRHPDAITAICDRAGVSRGGTFYHWMNGRADLRTRTLEKLANELGYRIKLERIEQ